MNELQMEMYLALCNTRHRGTHNDDARICGEVAEEWHARKVRQALLEQIDAIIVLVRDRNPDSDTIQDILYDLEEIRCDYSPF